MLRFMTLAVIAQALAGSSSASAGAVIVPDDFPTIQLAIESQADTVLIRSGDYSERVRMKFGPFEGFARSASLVLMAHPDESNLPIPRLTSVELVSTESDGRLECHGLRIGGALYLNGAENGSYNPVLIESCVMDSGLYVGDSDAIIRSCRIQGRAIFHYSYGGFESDTLLQGGGILAQGEGSVSVMGCVFEGPGDVAFESTMFNRGDVTFAGNHVRDYRIAVRTGELDAMTTVRENRIERCGTGITVSQGFIHVIGNDVRDCGESMVLRGDGLVVSSNRVFGSTGTGIEARLWDIGVMTLDHNVVGRCRGDGIVVFRDRRQVTLVSNTSASNGGSGFVIHGPDEGTADVRNNIGYGNRGSGLHARDLEGLTLACNDWFGNALGDVTGIPPGAADRSVDPLFCDVESGDLTLMAGSPLLDAPGCGRIGALGVGCGATPVLVAFFRAESTADGILIEWRWGGLDRPLAFVVERADDAGGPWGRIEPEPRSNGETVEVLDRHVEGGRTYFYRLAWVTERGDPASSEAISIAVPGTLALALTSITPNPASGRVEIVWSLPRAGHVDLAMVDVAGRVVARLASGQATAGQHASTWNGSAPPGLYLVRLRHEGNEITRRVFLRR